MSFAGWSNFTTSATFTWAEDKDESIETKSDEIRRKFWSCFHGQDKPYTVYKIQRKETNCCSKFEQVN
jgi:hypothetical protein